MSKSLYSWDDCWVEINRLRRDLHRVFDRMRQLSPGRSGRSSNVDRVAEMALEFAAEVCGVKLTELKSCSRKNTTAWARHIAACLTKEFTGATLVEVKQAFGYHDHNSVRYAVRRVRGETLPKYLRQIEEVRCRLRSALVGQPLASTAGPMPRGSRLKKIAEEK